MRTLLSSYSGVRMKNDEFRGIFVLRPLLSILQPLKVAVKCLIMVVEQKFKVLWKAEKEIYQNMNSNVREIQYNFAEFFSIMC